MNNFYENDLNFSCVCCSKYCINIPSILLLSESNVIKLSKSLKLSPKKFVDVYCREVECDK